MDSLEPMIHGFALNHNHYRCVYNSILNKPTRKIDGFRPIDSHRVAYGDDHWCVPTVRKRSEPEWFVYLSDDILALLDGKKWSVVFTYNNLNVLSSGAGVTRVQLVVHGSTDELLILRLTI